MDLYFFSFTGISREIAFHLGKLLSVKPKEIRTYKFPYLIWLITSFIKGFEVKIEYEPVESAKAILVFPKWTFNCPPITRFLKEVSFERLFMIITYGGFQERPYAEAYMRLALKRCQEVETYLVKRSRWFKEKEKVLEELMNFLFS